MLEEVAALPRLDLLALQEVSTHAGVEDARAIAEALGPGYRWWQERAQSVRGLDQGNALVWDAERFELAPAGVLDLPAPEGRLLSRLPPSRRNALVAEGHGDGLSVRVVCVHLDVLGLTHKHAQLAHVLDDLDGRPRVELTLLAGDLNTYGMAGAVRWTRLRARAWERGFAEVSRGVRWTHRAARVRQKLDAVFAAPRGVRHRAWTVPTAASDHLPVLVELEK